MITLSESEVHFLLSRMMVLDEKSNLLEDELGHQRTATHKVLEEAEKGLLSAMEKYKALLDENRRLKEQLVESLTLNSKLTKLLDEASRQMTMMRDVQMSRAKAAEAAVESSERSAAAVQEVPSGGSETEEKETEEDKEESHPSDSEERAEEKKEEKGTGGEGDDVEPMASSLERRIKDLEIQNEVLRELRARERAAAAVAAERVLSPSGSGKPQNE